MKAERWFALAVEEPYRWMFPLGILIGLLGVALWPLWFAGWIETYPGIAHGRIMTEGFYTAFILGFLGTAGPRLLEVEPLPGKAWALIATIFTGSQVASLFQLHNLAEAAFALTLMLFLVSMFRKTGRRKGMPPPGFVLVVLSLLCAIPAAVAQMPAVQQLGADLPAIVWISSRSFLVEFYILLPILGAAPFFLGRFGGLPPRHRPVDSARPDATWKRQALLCAALGIGLITSLLLKNYGAVKWGALFQAALTLLYVLTQVPWQYPSPVSTLGRIVQLSLVALVLAPLLEAFMPEYRLAWRHLMVMAGFQWVTVGVATWVVFSHAGHQSVCMRKSLPLRLCALGWVIALVSRLVAEWMPAIRDSHLLYAAVIWILASTAWLVFLAPRLRQEDVGQ